MSCLRDRSSARRVLTGIIIALYLVTIIAFLRTSEAYHGHIELSVANTSTDKVHTDATQDMDQHTHTRHRLVKSQIEKAKTHVQGTNTDATHDIDQGTHTQHRLVKSQILDLAKSLEKAKTHVRGTKTSDELRRAITLMDNILKSLEIDKNKIKRKIVLPKSVCPEIYKGHYGKFRSWFKVTECTYARPLWKLVTVVSYLKESNRTTMQYKANRFLNSVNDYGLLKVVLATNSHYSVSEKMSSRVTVQNSINETDGVVWNKLVSAVKTPYVLIARNIDVLTQDAMLERLVREMEFLQVAVVAGAVRYQDGHWKKGCYQSVHRNFTLKYVEGYDESLHECLFCDFTVGPFLTSVQNFMEFADESEGIFEDWFLRLDRKRLETIVCPDSMFNMYYSTEASTWSRFMRNWNINKVVLPQGETIVSQCGSDNDKPKTKSLPPCVLQSNADLVKLTMDICETQNILCKLRAGTLLGAIKFEKVLPWEWDADITCPTLKLSSLVLALKATSNRTHLRVEQRKSSMTCPDKSEVGGHFKVYYKHWWLDLIGLPSNCDEADEMTQTVDKPTRVFFDGNWFPAPHNPGLDVRNEYGREIYQHVEHHYVTDTEVTSPYIPGHFKPCETPNDHNCLDRYNTDGDMSFKESLP